MSRRYIEERFKEVSPEITISNIKHCLDKVGVVLNEKVRDAGIGDCFSVHVSVPNAYPLFTNGKGVSRDLARASAYAEFIERLQCGLFLYKFQSISNNRIFSMQHYAPDGQFMTMQQLEEQGEWMDPIIEKYGNGLTRGRLAKQCQMYACTQEDKILTLPYYSLFEDKYVYLPAGFVEHVYSANGCCAGNSRDEAWVHGLSEIMERNRTITILTSKESVPIISDSVLSKYETPWKLLMKIRENKDYDVTIFDFSDGSGYPVIGVRIIDKKKQIYLVNTAADPVFEIALSRGLTEIFQGQELGTLRSQHNGKILTKDSTITKAYNILNQIETGNGLFFATFFSDRISCNRNATVFDDNSQKNNSELLDYVLEKYRKLGRPVYVRNCSFLGFHSYQFVIPGFSETRGLRLTEPMQEYAFGDSVARVYRNPETATAADYTMVLLHFKKIQSAFSRRRNFSGLAGLPMKNDQTVTLLYGALAYSAFKLGRFLDAANYTKELLNEGKVDEGYFRCVSQFLSLSADRVPSDQIKYILEKFNDIEYVEKLYKFVESNKTPFEEVILRCKYQCESCSFNQTCHYRSVAEIIEKAGSMYREFSNGQNRELLRIK